MYTLFKMYRLKKKTIGENHDRIKKEIQGKAQNVKIKDK